jgi:hypothetical protein
MEYNITGVVKNQIRDRALLYGYEQAPTIVSNTTPAVPADGAVFYQFRCLGAANAVIASAIDANGAAVAGLAGVTITAGDFPYNFRLSSITLTSGSIVLYSKLTADL